MAGLFIFLDPGPHFSRGFTAAAHPIIVKAASNGLAMLGCRDMVHSILGGYRLGKGDADFGFVQGPRPQDVAIDRLVPFSASLI